MKKRDTFFLSGLAIVLLLTSATLNAQVPTAVEIANEVMTSEQSAALVYVGSTFGIDSGSPLNFSTHIDPAGQSFSFSLNNGSTYLGKPITLTTTGTVDAHQVWQVSSSGSFGGVPWTETTKFVPPSASGYGSKLHPCYLGCSANVYYAALFHFTPECCFYPPALVCDEYASWPSSGGVYDQEYCYNVDPFTGGPIPQSGYYSTSFHVTNGGAISWGWNGSNLGAEYWGTITASGTSYTDGSPGNSTSVLTPISVNSTNYFGDFGTGESSYQCCTGLPISGSGGGGTSYTEANQFTAGASGSVSRMDFGVSYVSGADSFYAALYTDSNGLPGTLIGFWDNLSSNLFLGQCCGKVTVSGISGISLTAGESYFAVLGPEKLTDTTSLTWNANSQNIKGLYLYSNDGGQSWNSNGTQTLGTFDVLSEPVGIMTNAMPFTVAVDGSVSQIDVAVAYVSGTNSFSAALYTNDGGVPGIELARWDNLSSSQPYNNCCGLVSITGIAGLNLSAGEQFFLVLAPEDLQSNTVEQWNLNLTGATGSELFSLDGGSTWNTRNRQVLAAFDVIGSSTLYSNLGTGAEVYQCCSGLQISGGTQAPHSLVAGK